MESQSANNISFKRLLQWYIIIAAVLMTSVLLVTFAVHFFGSARTYNGLFFMYGYFLKEEFLIYLFVGLAAQMIDGTLGMAYGISSTSFLMSAGVSPAVASTCVHIAEVFTTGISGISHWKFGNVDKEMFKKLAIPGALGAATGAYLLSSFNGDAIKPYIAAYLLLMGLLIMFKSFKKVITFKKYNRVRSLALFGGFVDASGGGGWGPVVTSTLIGSGNNPKMTIGTVNAVEFFVSMTAAGIFTVLIGFNNWLILAGLIAGGAIAAPFGAYLCNKVNARTAMIMVGLLIIFLSGRTIFKSLVH